MRLWKINKRSSTLADMSMNRMLLTELIAKGALVGMIAGFCGATYRYLILESEHIRWQLMDGITMEWAIGWLIVMVIFAFIVDRCLHGLHYLVVLVFLKSKEKCWASLI